MRTLRRFLSRWKNWPGLLIVAAFVLMAAAAPVLSPNDPKNPGPVKRVGRATDFTPHPPSPEAPLGTMPGQLSVYHTLVWGTRSALGFGLTVALIAALVGVLIGTTSAYFGGFTNDLLMRITDTFLAFPMIAGVIFIRQMFTIVLYNAGTRLYMGGLGGGATAPAGVVYVPEDLPLWLTLMQKIDPVMIAFILFSWMPYARIMNMVVRHVMETEYVQAARAMGVSHTKIITRHLIPNSITPVIVMAARDIGGMVLLQATFTFIGLGGDSLWGMLLARGRDWVIGPGGNIFTYWWLFLPPTLALVLFGVGWNLLGDSLNEALNPRSR